MKKRIIAAALAAMLALTVGCGKKEETAPTTESGIEAVKTEEELRDESELAEIENSKEVTPERVAALSRNAASMWRIAGGQLAAGVEEASGVPKDAVFGTESDPDIDAVLNFGADLILVDKVSENYQDMVSLLDMTEGAPPYIVIDIHNFDDYADSMLQMAKYTKDVEAYKLGVIDVRRKNAEVIARGQEALKVLIQTMPLPEGSLLPGADDESAVEAPAQAKADTASNSTESRVTESGLNSTESQVTESRLDSTVSNSTESGLDSAAESYPADSEKVADKRESITVLLMRVDAEGCTIQGSHDYVSNMFADFGLVNVNPGYEVVRVTLPKEDEIADSNAKSGDSAESQAVDGAENDSAAKSGETVESQAVDGAENDSAAESGETVESQTVDGAETGVAAESGETVDGQTVDGAETDSAAESGEAADSQATDSQIADSQTGDNKEKEGDGAQNMTEAWDKSRPANEIEFETILSRNPDYIFLIFEGKEKTAEKTYKAICESKEFWSHMTAVRNRHVYTLPQSTFAYPPNDQWDLAYEYLYQMMFVM